jgi:hypothetical protein
MKTEETTPEIIEIIDDDSDVFGERAANTTVHDTGGPRWIGPAAAAALIAIIGYGIATSASTSSIPKVAPAPSTTVRAPTTTEPAPSTTEPPKLLVPFYAANPPRQLTIAEADTFDPDFNYSGPGFYQLWATEGATANSGSWFTAVTYSAAFSSVWATDAYRVQTPNNVITISHLPGGQTSAQFYAGTTSVVSLLSFGFTDEALVELADSINVARSHVQFSDRSLISNFRVLSSVDPYFALQGNPAEQIYYSDGNDPLGGFSIVVSPRSASTAGSSTLDRQIAARFLLNNPTEFAVDGHVAVAGDLIGQQNVSLAAWVAGDHLVTVSGQMPAAELIPIASTVHEVSAEEWAGMQFQATRHSGDNNFGNYEQTAPVPVGFGTDSSGEIWTIKASTATFDDQRQVNWEWAGGGNTTRIDDTAQISTVADTKRTYVLADLPRAVAPTAQLQILRDGFEPVLVPFADIDTSFDRTFAAYAFSEPTTYTAQVIGADGAVLANWPAS